METHEYETMSAIEDRHWWFVGRRAIVASLLKRFLPPMPVSERSIFEAGCGTGGNLSMLSEFANVSAMEPSTEGRALANQRGITQVRDGHLPERTGFENTMFDAIVMTDVLEHIEDDTATLTTLRNHLKPDGTLLLTVPAFMFLWSEHDTALHHKRRYVRPQLVQCLHNSGFDIRYISYYNTFLFFAVSCIRMIQRIKIKKLENTKSCSKKRDADKVPFFLVNRLLYTVFASERHFLGKISFPFGISLVVVATPKH